MQLVLFEPEIPPNTGNIVRLCAAFDVPLHLIEPLGFRMEDRYLKRAGLDYWPHARLVIWPSWAAYLEQGLEDHRLVASSSRKGEAAQHFAFSAADALVLGPETRGLPPEILAQGDACLRIPIRDCVRSLNLSSAAAILLYHALSATGGLEEI